MVSGLGLSFLALCWVQSASTWRTPEEWTSLVEASRVISEAMPSDMDQFLVAPEALIYHADRRGFRLEFDPDAVRRAAGEWGQSIPDADRPLALVDFYRDWADEEIADPQHYWYARVSVIADIGPAIEGSRREAWREAVRASPDYKILIDRPGSMIAEVRR